MKNPVVTGKTARYLGYLSLGGVLLLALLLRLYGIDWGLPTALHPNHTYHPDEVPLLVWSQWLSQGQLIAKQFIYGGTFYFVILRACLYFGGLLEGILGELGILASAILVARYLQVVLALVAVLLVYEAGRLFYDRRTGLVAALILALAPAHIIATQTVRPDAIAAFMVALIVLLTAKLWVAGPLQRTRLLMYSATVIGAAAAFRLPLIAFGLLPVATYAISRHQTLGGPYWKLLLDRNLIWLGLIAVLTYSVLSPHTLMHPEALMVGIQVTASYETAVFPDAAGRGPIFFQYAWRLLHQALGYPAYFLAIVGMAYMLVRRLPQDKLLLAGIALYFAMLAAVTLTFVRYTVPLIPLLALSGGVAVVRLLDQHRRGPVRIVAYTVAGFAVGWTLIANLAFLHVVASKNVRETAGEWIAANIPAGESVLFIQQYDGDVFFNPPMSPRHRNLIALLQEGADGKGVLSETGAHYLVLHELIYADMERLGDRHPRREIRDLGRAILDSGVQLAKETKAPVGFVGVDFSGSFAAVDYSVVNPGIRVYRISGVRAGPTSR